MPGIFGDDPRADGILGVRAAHQILHEEILARGVCHHVLVQPVEGFRVHRLVVVPPDCVAGGVVADNEFVLGGTAGVLAGQRAQGAEGRQPGLAAGNGQFDKFGFSQIISHDRSLGNSGTVYSLRGIAGSKLFEHFLSSC